MEINRLPGISEFCWEMCARQYHCVSIGQSEVTTNKQRSAVFITTLSSLVTLQNMIMKMNTRRFHNLTKQFLFSAIGFFFPFNVIAVLLIDISSIVANIVSNCFTLVNTEFELFGSPKQIKGLQIIFFPKRTLLIIWINRNVDRWNITSSKIARNNDRFIEITLMPRERTKGDNPHKIVVQTGSC